MRLRIVLNALISFTNASALGQRASAAIPSANASTWAPETKNPHFFTIRVDEKCTAGQWASACPFAGYAIRLLNEKAVATPYNQWWDPKLPMFFVDSNTKTYTASKQPLQFYINTVDGSLHYSQIGGLPAASNATDFSTTGDNPQGLVAPSPSYFLWNSTGPKASPSTAGTWWLCPMPGTGNYQVYSGDSNVDGGASKKDCVRKKLAAVDANPFN
ncbi:hypothetical protein ACEQ8H_004847 [Pleosporales sp. CAS-2024a]